MITFDTTMKTEVYTRVRILTWVLLHLFLFLFGSISAQNTPAERHIVKKGETLYSISKKYNVTQQELIQLNPGVELGLREGVELILHKTNTPHIEKTDSKLNDNVRNSHVVVAGDTWFSLAKKYGTTVEVLRERNKSAGEDLKVGQTIEFPTAVINEKESNQEIRPTYSVAYMLPFYSDAPDSVVNKNKKFQKASVQFYRGAMMALDSVEHLGLRAKVDFYDVHQDTNTVSKAIAKMDKTLPDLCIGPLFRESIAKTLRLLGKSPTHIVMPVQQSPKVLLLDKDISKVVPGAATEWGYLASYLIHQEKLTECILLQSGNQEEIKLLNAFKDEWRRNNGGMLTELNSKDAADTERLKVLLAEEKNPVVIYPCSDEVGIRKMISEFGHCNLRLYGHEKWLPISDIILEIPLGFKVSALKSNYLDTDDPDVIRWIEKYRITYKSEPDEFAFLGYDVSMFYLCGLLQYGDAISSNINGIVAPMISHVFDFVSTGAESGFENRHTDIIGIDETGELKIENR